MGLSDLMLAAKLAAPTGVKTDTNFNGKTNVLHVSNKIARAFMATVSKFKGMEPDDVTSEAIKLMKNSDIIAMYAKQGVVSDSDLVTVLEAIRWTGVYATTGKKLKFHMALIEPHGAKSDNAHNDKKVNSWNGMVLEDTQLDGDIYNGYGHLAELVGYNLRVLGKSDDLYDVTLS